MGAFAIESGRRWLVAVILATGIMAGFVLLLSLPPPSTPLPATSPRESVRPTVKIARPDDTDALVKEEAELRDLRPLFLPTDRNAALPEPRLEPGRTFLDSEGRKLRLSDSDVQLSGELPPVATVGGKPVAQAVPLDALGPEGPGGGLLGFGRREAASEPFEPRGGYIEVTSWLDGRRVQAEGLPTAAGPQVDRPWGPLELIGVVDQAGLASPLVVTEGSRVEEVDLHFKNFLTHSYRIGDRLNPGIYRIVVAP